MTFLSLTDNGTNQIEFIHVSEKALIATNVNVDDTGKKTEQLLLFGRYALSHRRTAVRPSIQNLRRC